MQTLTLGEVLWDIIEGEPYLGGAPLNVAAHLSRMGADSYLISAVGRDTLGIDALYQIQEIGIHVDFIHQHHHKPTGTVDVFLNQGQPDYTIHQDVAWDYLEISPEKTHEIINKDWDCVVIGILAQRSKHNHLFFHELLAKLNTKEVFLDINLRKSFYNKAVLEESFRVASILKLSDEEVDTIADLFYHERLTYDNFAEKMMHDFDLGIICLTLGKDGAKVYTELGHYHVPAPKIQVADTIGAGDSFSAAFIYTLHQYGDERLAAEKGCQLGGFIASQSGALPEYSPDIKALLK